MHIFALHIIEAIQGNQVFEKLLVDGVAPFDTFENNIEESDKRSLEKIHLYMEDVANNKPLPKTKFRDITPKKERVKEYEFKDGNIRVYAISKYGGKIIVIGGYKNRQQKDIVSFRSLKAQYLEQENTKTTYDEKRRTPKK